MFQQYHREVSKSLKIIPISRRRSFHDFASTTGGAFQQVGRRILVRNLLVLVPLTLLEQHENQQHLRVKHRVRENQGVQ